jgi:hypothetical protein
MNNNPSLFPAGTPPAGVDVDRLPVEFVTWDEAVEFCRAKDQLPGRLC